MPRRPDTIFVDKQAREAKIIDIAIPADARVTDKELEKIEKYQLLREEIGKMWRLKKVTDVPVVIEALGAVSDMFEKYMGKLDVTMRLEVIQKMARMVTITNNNVIRALHSSRFTPFYASIRCTP